MSSNSNSKQTKPFHALSLTVTSEALFMAFTPIFLLILSILSIIFPTKTLNQQILLPNSTIPLGSSLSPHSSPWLSPSGLFAFGFFPLQNDVTFSVGVFIVSDKTVVWTANRDDPPLPSTATLRLTPSGQITIDPIPNRNQTRVLAAPSRTARSAAVLDSGNLVLLDGESRVVWESFASPTDTILGGQNLTAGRRLTSAKSVVDRSSGRFWLIMQEDGNAVAYPANSSAGPQESYWASGILGFSADLVLDQNGSLFTLGKNDSGAFTRRAIADAAGGAAVHRATLDPDGIFRLYVHEIGSDGESSRVLVQWEAVANRCDVKGICGFNSYCDGGGGAGAAGEASCYCFPGFEYVDPTVKYLGCYQNFAGDNCKANMKSGLTRYNMSDPLENVGWINYPYSVLALRKELCSKSCLDDCNCRAISYTPSSCRKFKLPLRYGTRDETLGTTAFFKAISRSIDDPSGVVPIGPASPVKSKDAPVLVLALSLGSFALLCLAIAVASGVVYNRRVYRYKKVTEYLSLELGDHCALRSFSYEELENATEGFREELGRGGFGAVYKGKLPGGSQVIAVKRLEKVVEEGIREFRAEMNTIGRTHHRNLVQLIGFCLEGGSKKLLVYEFMSNGSLADRLFGGGASRPGWRERVRIVLDVARGVFYLHEECGVHIIHCNLKPQNILLDENWTAKISDFGLARLAGPSRGKTSEEANRYFAPEWKKSALISVKSDVYSFGVVLLETVCCRRYFEAKFSEPDEIILSDWVYRCFTAQELRKIVGDDEEEVDMAALQRMAKVGLWCIQDDPARRPPMKNVILMLEGTMDIPVPPCPHHSLVS